MPRAPRIEYAGVISHQVMNRGDHLESIFEDEEDRKSSSRLLTRPAFRLDGGRTSFVLMGNHSHLFDRDDEGYPGQGYAVPEFHLYGALQCPAQDTGAFLFEGRYKALLVDWGGGRICMLAALSEDSDKSVTCYAGPGELGFISAGLLSCGLWFVRQKLAKGQLVHACRIFRKRAVSRMVTVPFSMHPPEWSAYSVQELVSRSRPRSPRSRYRRDRTVDARGDCFFRRNIVGWPRSTPTQFDTCLLFAPFFSRSVHSLLG